MNHRPRAPARHPELAGPDPRRIVVVGPCASGKSTLVSALQDLGYDARVTAQEHSEIANLWQRSGPDVLIALKVDVAAIKLRRGDSWPEWLHGVQVTRLKSAFAAADLAIDTSRRTVPEMIAEAKAYLQDDPLK